MLRRTLLFAVSLLCAGAASGAETTPPSTGKYQRVDVAPTKTSIYIGTVSMTMPTFERKGGAFVAAYTAKVFPFAFYNEKGVLSVDVSDDQLARLARGETIEFTGRAERTDGAERKVSGKATPADATSGKLKVRVTVSKRVELIFNTTYRFRE